MQRRLDAVLTARAKQTEGPYVFFQTVFAADGEFDSFFLLQTGEHLGFDAFCDRAEADAETVYVLLPSTRPDPEAEAFWAEQDAALPQSWAEMQAENRAVEAGDTEALDALIAAREARRAADPAAAERRRLAARYEQRIEAWAPFEEEMAARLDSMRSRGAV